MAKKKEQIKKRPEGQIGDYPMESYLDEWPLDRFFEHLGEMPFFSDLDLAGRLKNLVLFKSLSQEKLSEIAEHLRFRFFPSGSIIARQGDYDHNIHIVLSGTVEIAYNIGGKNFQFGPGVFFGEAGALSGNPRNANVVARTDALLIEIPRKTFLHLYNGNGQFQAYINKFYIERAVTAHLRSLDIFKKLNEEQFRFLLGAAKLKRFTEGDTIVREGDKGETLYLVRTGFVRISRQKGDRDVVITYMKEGNYFGEMSLVTGEVRSATVTAETELVECIVLAKEDFDKILEGEPELKKHILEIVKARIDEQAKRMAEDDESSEERFNIFRDLVQSDEVLVIDMNNCIRCGNCVTACEQTHGVARMSLSGDVIDDYVITSSCRHCANPKCLKCNYDAIRRDPDGEVWFTDNCIGCGDCSKNCPYGMISMVSVEPEADFNIFEKLQFWKPAKAVETAKKKREPVKCNMCRELPYESCMSNCPTSAMKFISIAELAGRGEIQ